MTWNIVKETINEPAQPGSTQSVKNGSKIEFAKGGRREAREGKRTGID